MPSLLKNGDIFIDTFLPPSVSLKEMKEDMVFKNMGFENLAIHGLIYNEQKVYHATEGSKYVGVKSHDLVHSLRANKRLFDVGERQVLRCKDEKISQGIAAVVVRWDHPSRLKREDLDRLPKDKENKTQLPTRFTDLIRPADEIELKGIHELYRAFRAHYRNHHNLPLSKEKGVSCSDFLAYVIKVSIIDRIFPSGLPEKLLNKFLEIERMKLSSSEESKEKKISKLTQIPLAHFTEFERIARECFVESKRERSKDVESKDMLENQDEYIKYLSSPIKGNSIAHFCDNIYDNFKSIFSFEGYLFLQEEAKSSEGAIMTHGEYQTLLNLKPRSIFLPLVIPKVDLDRLEVLSRVSLPSSGSSPSEECKAPNPTPRV